MFNTRYHALAALITISRLSGNFFMASIIICRPCSPSSCCWDLPSSLYLRVASTKAATASSSPSPNTAPNVHVKTTGSPGGLRLSSTARMRSLLRPLLISSKINSEARTTLITDSSVSLADMLRVILQYSRQYVIYSFQSLLGLSDRNFPFRQGIFNTRTKRCPSKTFYASPNFGFLCNLSETRQLEGETKRIPAKIV